ncbi:epiplakin-like [Melanotaenia boesemani]|uniref:epiplakin-like n=1 Tax=Melanotaenia boesemani TaxID=1250792 RepID=UPI001C0510CC|nr:epiplakin-like [Melanotaenia boesemani]
MYGSQQGLNMNRRANSKSDLAGAGTYHYARSEGLHGDGNGYEPSMDGYRTYSISRSLSKGGGMASGAMGAVSGSPLNTINQRAATLQIQCNEYLKKAEYSIQSGSAPGDAEYYMGLAREAIERLKTCAIDLSQMGQPNDNVVRSVEVYKNQLKGVHMAISGTVQRRRSTRGSSGGWEEPGRSFHDAMGWISQQKRLIETASWGDDPATLEQQLINHQKFHSSIQRCPEMDRAKDDLQKKGDKPNMYTLEKEWDSLQQMSFGRTEQLRDLIHILQDISKEIMWVNDKEEEELMFNWGDKNIEQYIPKKQESYSKLMSALEEKEKDLYKLKTKVNALLKDNHPASDKIEAYRDTLQTQWSWLLQITKCIDVHLKENGAYCQFFKEANETYSALQKKHEMIRKTYVCDKNTSLEDLLELLKGLEREKEKILEQRRQVQHLVINSKSIVRLKPRNPEEKSGSIVVKALCDFKQDQKVICKGDEAILKDNSQRSKWLVTGPGGLDMLVPSVCLIVPPPNPLGISLASKNEQYYEAILSIWNQLYINVKSLIAWQYCLLDIKYINSLTITMLAKMRPEEYQQIMKNLETHYEEFKLSCHSSQMFAEEDKRGIENQFTGAQAHYDKLVVELPVYTAHQEQIEMQQVAEQQRIPHLIIIQQTQQSAVEEEARRLEEERRSVELKKLVENKMEVKKEVVTNEQVIKKDTVKVTKTEPVKRKVLLSSSSSSSLLSSSRTLSELHTLRLRLEAAEGTLSQHVHVCFGDDGARDCGLKITQLETVQREIDSMREEYLRLRENILKEVERTNDADKAQFLRSEIGVINQRLGSLESSSSAYVQRLRALRDMLESVARAEDIVKVHEARLTEKETTSLSPTEVQDYMFTLKNIKLELDQKKDVLACMEAELTKANHWNSQVGSPFHRCDMMLSKYTELVSQLFDRWRRIKGQIESRLQDLQLYLPQLQHYKQTSTSFIQWVDATRKTQDTLQATQIDNVQALKDHITNQKTLNMDIKAKRETLESVLRDSEACVNAIKDYETDLASYSSGLETLLNIPIKRTMLKSPSMDLHQEATYLQTRYMELLTLSGDYYKFLGELLKNMEALKIRSTQIDLLEEELRLLRDNIQERNNKNKSLEDAVARYQLELSQSQDQLLSLEEVKQSTALECSATKESLDSTQSQLADLSDQVTRLNYLLSEERRKTKLAEERYTQQSEEYESVLKKRQNELETFSWSKMEVEKSVANKEHEIVQLRRQLDKEEERVKELQTDISKTRTMMQSIQSQHSETVNERDALLLKLKMQGKDKDFIQRTEEELSRVKMSLNSELRSTQRLQEENERIKRDLSYWKDQCDDIQSLLRQYDTSKEILEREKKSLKSEVEKLMREHNETEDTYKSRMSSMQRELQEVTVVRETMETQLKSNREPPGLDASHVIFDGVRKPVTAKQLLDCGILDKPTFDQLAKEHKTVPEVSNDKKVSLKGTGPIAGVVIEGLRSPGSITGPLCKLTFTEAKKENLLPPDSIDLLLDAQAATGHIIDPRTNQKLTVEEAYNQGVVDDEDRERLLAAEAAAVGYNGPETNKPLSVFQAMKKGLIDKNTTLRLLQAQESVGGILDPLLSVFLPRDAAIERNLIDDNTCHALNQRPELYLDPENEEGTTYMAMKRRCKIEPHTGLLLLPIPEKVDPNKLIFDGVRKPVTAKQLLDCGVLDKPTFKDLERGKKSVPEVSVEKTINLKGTGPIAGIVSNPSKMSLSEAKNQMLISAESADLLLEAQAATGHIIDPKTNQKLTVEEACARGVVDINDRDRLLEAEAAAIGYKDPNVTKPICVFEAMKRGIIDDNSGLRLLQAQESVGGILDPNLSVFLPKDTAIKRNLLDEKVCYALNQTPECYIDPDTERNASYGALKKICKIEPHTGLLFLPIAKKLDPNKLIFDGVRKPVTAKQLLDCGVLDKPTFNQLVKGEKTVPEVSVDKKIPLKGTGSIAGLVVGPSGKMSLTKAKKQMLVSPESVDLLLEAQAATGHIIDPSSNQKLTVEEACVKGVVDKSDQDKLLAAEAAAIGYKDPHTAQPLSVYEAMKKGLIDKKTGLRLLQAQESAGGILDPNLSVFLPKETAIKRNLLDEDLCRELSKNPECYTDPETEQDATYGALKKRCKTEPHTGLMLLPISERKDPSKLMFDGVRKPVSAQQLLDCGVLDKPTFNQLVKGEKTVPEVSVDRKIPLKGTGSIAGLVVGPSGKMSLTKAKKQMLVSPESTDLLLEAQAATGHIIEPSSNQKLTVEEACVKGVVDKSDLDKLLAAEAAAVGYKDPHTAQPLSVYEAMKKGLIDKKTGLRLLQAQESAGGILDPNLSVFLPKETAMKRNLLDEDLCRELSKNPECYTDPETEQDATYGALKKRCKIEPHTGLMLLPVSERKDPSKLMFDGVRKPVSAQQLLDCGVLDKPTFNQLVKGEKTVPEVSVDKKIPLKGTGSIAGLVVGPSGKMSLTKAKKQMLVSPESVDLLLEAQAATGHIIDPSSNQKLTVEEACIKGVVDKSDRDKLLAAEAAAIGYKDPHTAQPLSVYEAMKKGLIDKKTGLRLLQAQESAGGILDPNLSVFLPKETAIKRNLLDEDLCRELSKNPECYTDPETEQDATYGALKKRCKTEPHTGLMLLPISERKDPSKLMFDGVRKPVSAQQLLDCGVLDKPTFNQLVKGEKTVPEVSVDKKIPLKGTGSIAGLVVGPSGKMSLTKAKKQMLVSPESADLLLEAQAATGHIIEPSSNQKLTVEEACVKGVVDKSDRDKLLAAEAAAVGYKDPHTAQPLSVYEAMKKRLIDRKTGLRLLQAQESAGGILDPNLSVFLPKETAIKRNLLDEDLCRELSKNPECYTDPETEQDTTYGALKKRCKIEPHTGLMLLPVSERKDPSKLMFDGVRKPVSAQQLLDCGVLDKPTFNQLVKGEKTVPEVSVDKKIPLKGTGSIAGLVVGPSGKMSLTKAKKQMLVSPESADLLLEAQAATGHIIDPSFNQKLTVEEACIKGVVDKSDRDKLLAAEAAAIGYKDPHTAQPLSVYEAMKKGLIDKKTGLRLLQAQESAGGILDPNLSVFLPKETAIKRKLLDEDLCRELSNNPECYTDPETEQDTTYGALKKRCKTESYTGLMLLPISERKDPSKLMFDGVRKPVSAQQLLDCGVLDKPTFNQLVKGEKTVPEVSVDKKIPLKGTGSIAGLVVGPSGKMSLTKAKKQMLVSPESADLLLEAQAATGHIIDPSSNQKLTVEEACIKGVVDKSDRDKLLAAEAAAIGYKDPHTAQPLSVYEAMKKGLIAKKTGLRLLQAQESAGGILDPNLSVFLPKETAIKRNLLDEDLCRELSKNPECYTDPETEQDTTYGALKKRCKTESYTGLMLLPVSERKDPSKLMFDGVRKPVSAQQLLDCGVLDKPTFNQLVKGEKTVPEVSVDKKIPLKGTGSIAGLVVGPSGKMSLTKAKKQMLVSPESADLLLEAQAATGHIIDPSSNQKLTVEEACVKGVVDKSDRDKLLAAEAAAVGYKDPHTAQPLSVYEAMKKRLIDKMTGLRLLQAQESAGGILDPNLSVFLPKETAIKRNLLDEDLCRELSKNPECYTDPETEQESTYGALKKRCKTESYTGLMLLPVSERKDPSKLMFDGVRKPVSAQQLLDCGVLDKPTFDQLVKGEKTVPEVSVDKKIPLKGTGSIAGVVVGPSGKMSLTKAKKQMLVSPESADLLLEAQAATGHIIEPSSNQKLTVEEACVKGVVDKSDRDKLLAAEAAAVGHKDPHTAQPLSVYEAMKKRLIDKKTGLRLLQAQESAGGILDPNLSVFLPKETAIKRNLLDEDLCRELSKNPECYTDPETEQDTTYGALKKRCKTESYTGLMLLPVSERKDPSKLMFDGVRKPVSAQQLLDCGVLDKPTFDQLVKGEKTVPEVSVDKKIPLKGTGSIAGVLVRTSGKMSLTKAKKQMLVSPESADLLLEAQAATGHIIEPSSNQKLTVEEACIKGVVDKSDRDKLLAAEAAAVGYKDPHTAQPLSVYEAMKKRLIDKKTGLRLLQAQESAGGILDPNLSVFLPKETAMKRNLLDEDLCRELSKNPECYTDPETEQDSTYGALKKRCKTEPHTGLMLLPVSERKDPSKLMFDGVRKPVSAQQLLDCGVLDKPTFDQLVKGEKTVPEVSVDKKIPLKGTGSIAGLVVGPSGKMSLTKAKKQMLVSPESADLLLEAQAATGHIIDPSSNQKLTVEEACVKGVVDKSDRDKLLAAEAAAVGYKDPHTAQPLSVYEAMKKRLIDKMTGLRLLQAQESAGGILDPNLSVFLPKETAIKRNLLDEDLCRELSKNPECYTDPETEQESTYGALKKRCKTESYTGLMLLPVSERKDPSKLMFDGVRKPVSAQQLLDCGVLDKPTFDQLVKGEKTVPEVSVDKKIPLKGTGSIAGVVVGPSGKMSLTKAKKQMLVSPESADLLLEAQAATGHIIEPSSNQKLTVEEACVKGVVDKSDRDKLLAAEAAAVGHKDPHTAQPLSVYEAMKKRLIDKKTGLRLLQAQESAGGILDPNLSVFLPKETAIKRNLLDEDLCRELSKNPECYTDPETEQDTTYGALKKRCKTESYTGLMLLPVSERKDPSKLMFDGVRKPVSAQQLLDCGVLDKPTFDQLVKGEKTVPEVSVDKKIPLKGTGSIAGVLVRTSGKMSLTKAKKQMLVSPESADLLLEAQAATGHIIEPSSNQKLTVEEACVKGVVDKSDRDKLLAAEAAAVGYKDPHTAQPLSVYEAMKKGLIDKKTGLRLLQAQESAGGILDPNLSVFLPKETAMKRNLLDEDLCRELSKNPECYTDPETEQESTYGALKKRCKTESYTGLMLLPVSERKDPSKLMFDGVRKPVSAQQLLDCGVLDKPTFDQLMKGEKTVPEVSVDKKIPLKGTGSIAGLVVGPSGKMSLTKAKKQMLVSPESADLLLEAQAATGHIIDPSSNQKLTVEEACIKGVVDKSDQDKLLAAEAAAVGYKDPHTAQPLSVYEAMKKRLIDKKTGLRLLQAQESAGGILDPNLSVFLPKETAIKRNLLDEDLCRELSKNPECYTDPETEQDATYRALKKRCKTEPHTGLMLLPVSEKKDPSKLMFDGVRKPVSAQQLLDCGVLDKPTFNQLVKGEKTVQEVSVDKKIFLKGTGSIAGIVVGRQRELSFVEAKKQMVISEESADLLLEAQAATGYITDLKSKQKLTVEEACAKGLVDPKDRNRLLAAEAAVVGYKDTCASKPLSVFEALKKCLIDEKTCLRLLQAQESVGGILDPNLSVFLPKETALQHNLLNEKLLRALNQRPACYLDPETDNGVSYGALKTRCNTNTQTGLHILPVSEKFDASKLLFHGVRKMVSAQQLLDCRVLDKPTFNQLMKGEKTVSELSLDKKVFLKGTGSIAGVAAGPLEKMSFTDAKKQKIMSPGSADMLLYAQAATGHIIDPRTNQYLTVKEACSRGVVSKEDESMLSAAEASAIGYRDTNTGKLISAGQAMRKGLIDKNTALHLLQAQESVGGIMDPALSVFLPKDIAVDRDLIDEELYQALNKCPECYIDPDTEQPTTYVSLKKKCKVDPVTGLLLLPKPKLPFTVQGLRNQVSVIDLVDANLLEHSDINQLNEGKLTTQDIEDRLRSHLRGSTCIAGVYDEASDKVLPIYQAMKDGLLRSGTTLELLEAQAASGFIVDPVNNLYLTVSDAYNRRLFGLEFRDKLLAAERAVTGYKVRGTDKTISLFQAMEKGLIEKSHGIRLLEAQIASGGIIDPEHSIRIDVNVAYKRGYFNEEMNKILTDESDDTKDFFDPNTDENLTYLELKKRCIFDKKTGLILLPIIDKKKQEAKQKHARRRRRVIIVDPETNREMTIREAYDKGYIDYETFLELSEHECEWEEITITAPDGSTRFIIIDRKTGRQYDISELLEKRVIDQSVLQQYRSQTITLTQFADIITEKTKELSSLSTSTPSAISGASSVTSSSTSIPSAISGASSASKSLREPSVTSSSTSRASTSLMESSLTSTSKTGEVSMPVSLTSSSTFTSRPVKLPEHECEWEEITITAPDGSTRFIIIDRKAGRQYDISELLEKQVIDESVLQQYRSRTITLNQFAGLITEKAKQLSSPLSTSMPSTISGASSVTSPSTLRSSTSFRESSLTSISKTAEVSVPVSLTSSSSSSTFISRPVELSEEYEWEEITITAPDGSTRFIIIDRKTGRQYDISELLEKQVIDESVLRQYRSRTITLSQFADIVIEKTKQLSSSSSTSRTSTSFRELSVTTPTSKTAEASMPVSLTSSSSSSTSRFESRPVSSIITKVTTTSTRTVTEESTTYAADAQDSSDSLKHLSTVSITMSSPLETVGELAPVGAIFDTDTLEKISVTEALNRGLLDSITAQRLLEAQACTGGIVNPANGHRVSIQEASRMGIIDDDMATNLKPAQKAYIGFEDVKTKKKMSAAKAMKEMWLPYEAGHRFMEFQVVTGGLYDPDMGCRRSIEDALKMGWLDVRAAQRLQNIKHHTKNLTCPKSKLKISYKEALDNCLVEEGTGVRMLQASSVSSRGISSPYNVSSAPGSTTGSRSGSRRCSRRSSLDLGSPLTKHSSFMTSFSSHK